MTIDEVSKKFDLTKDTLRYWERIGLLPDIARNASGYREYDEHALNWVYYIMILRKAGMSIEALSEFVKLLREGDQTIAARKSLFIEQRDHLMAQRDNINKTLRYLDYKIDHFEDHMLSYENEKLAYEGKLADEK
ncbi:MULTISPECIES: MerR family transcriptional regulator [Lacticaseibacillus]|uniref:MerR family transcriptional regulator n=3 Tax=Lacticaseibacillus TaxID=2759736 RepID=A0A5R8LTD6_LACZE|nr:MULTISPECIES: MerR family transcriptional regulator [Lacticaseibacillus]KRK12135.1 transcriptional regulator [Lacticaseibacillus zeae DSM 20178 = KCTC 3804]MBI6597263.1 MerR family transcriptional regulator [Lacticaseibacillus casei]MBO1480920.1 MerR family transcriptional regulator [Lacticaseibacillus casei]MBO2416199.1 MerR family transcriptional regulator [Lacticaseibacillus casei]MCK2080652.1 MerR family transcriptional regulator [Lacticaseibacillus casei]